MYVLKACPVLSVLLLCLRVQPACHVLCMRCHLLHCCCCCICGAAAVAANCLHSQALIWDLSPLAQPAAPTTPPMNAAAAAAAEGGGGPGSNHNIASSAAAGGGGAGGAPGGPGSYNLDPILAYSGGAEINQLQWSIAQPDWVAVSFANKTQILRV